MELLREISKKKSLLLGLALGVSLFGAPLGEVHAEAVMPAYTQQDLNDELSMAVAWQQNAAEYRELCYQAYNTALMQVEKAVKMHKKGDKPLAIVLDADETVLDNSPFEAGLIGTGNAYSSKSWTAWCAAAEATAMPGATEYLNAVDKMGVAIFYVTNRSMDTQYEGTAKNMKALGFPQVDEEHMLLKTDKSDKQPRFDAVMKDYEVVVFMGDNAGDLPLGTYHKSQMERNAIIDANKKDFGVKYIVLPNPSYGDWEPALDVSGNYWKRSAKEKSEVRNQAMRKWRPADSATSQK